MRSSQLIPRWTLRVLPASLAVFHFAVASPGLAAQVEISARAARITVGGRLQTQFMTTSVDDVAGGFFHRRARLQADVEVGDFLDGRVEADFAGGGAALQDGWVRATFDPRFAVSLGQFKRAFSGFELASSTDMGLIERDGGIPEQGCPGVGDACSFSRLTQRLAFDGRDVGLRIEGALGERLTYTATFTNGQGTNADEVNDAKSASGRLVFALTDAMRVGAYAGTHDRVTALEETARSEAWGADFEVGTWRRGFHLLASAAAGDNWRAGAEAEFLALHALASYYAAVERSMLDGIEPLVRIGWADPERGAEDVAGWLVTPGAMLWLAGKNGLAVNLDAYAPDDGRDAEWTLRFQGYLFF